MGETIGIVAPDGSTCSVQVGVIGTIIPTYLALGESVAAAEAVRFASGLGGGSGAITPGSSVPTDFSAQCHISPMPESYGGNGFPYCGVSMTAMVTFGFSFALGTGSICNVNSVGTSGSDSGAGITWGAGVCSSNTAGLVDGIGVGAIDSVGALYYSSLGMCINPPEVNGPSLMGVLVSPSLMVGNVT